MHIKFLDHGKGSAAHASAYVLDQFDHRGNLRAGVQVLRGDATTFNSICNASPHLWKYTSGVIAWSKKDDPTPEQIMEVLNDFEKHAFAGLDQSQYHLFAVLHTDDDGSKHIHVLVPRLDLQSGKSLNIAPPGHEKHFDSLRDYFNTKYNWSRPDDPLLRNFTQEPNHIAKLNKQAEKIIAQHDLEKLKKSQFRRFINEHIHRLLGIEIENRADIVRALKQLNGVQSVKAGKNYLTVTLNNNDKHRLKGAFYDEKFELGAYAERLREAESNKPTDRELAAALTDADQLRETYRAKRAAYHEQYHPFKRDREYDKIHRIESKLDFDRGGENLSPQVLKEATMDYLVALKAIQEQISNTDISKLQRLSVSIESLQTEINKAIGSISVDQKSIQAQVQAQVKQAIEESQSELIETGIQSLLNSQKAKHMTWVSTVFGGLMILISFYTIYQSSTNLKTIQAQKEMIQQNSQTIQSQLNYLNSLRR